MSTADLDDERAVLEVVEFSESEDEDFDYKAVEVFMYMNRCARNWSRVSYATAVGEWTCHSLRVAAEPTIKRVVTICRNSSAGVVPCIERDLRDSSQQ